MKNYLLLLLILISFLGLVNADLDINQISSLKVNMVNNEIVAEISCSKDLVKIDFNLLTVDMVLFDDVNIFNHLGVKQIGLVDCNISPIKYILKNNNLVENKTYLVNAIIFDCVNNCKEEAYVYYSKQKQNVIPDNNFILIVLIVSFVGFICTKKRI
jgi:hypothetical protein